MFEYSSIVVLILFSVVLSIVLYLLFFLLVLKQQDYEKISSYECGFDPFGTIKNKLDIKFYLVAILFLIFDIEIVYLFPWSLYIFQLNYFGIVSMFIFLFILLVGFFYELYKGALDWY